MMNRLYNTFIGFLVFGVQIVVGATIVVAAMDLADISDDTIWSALFSVIGITYMSVLFLASMSWTGWGHRQLNVRLTNLFNKWGPTNE
jgi:hypothetical protein